METEEKCCKTKSNSAPAGGAVYGLGLIGAMIYFISQATGFWLGVLGVLKAIIWPVFFVIDGFKHFNM